MNTSTVLGVAEFKSKGKQLDWGEWHVSQKTMLTAECKILAELQVCLDSS